MGIVNITGAKGRFSIYTKEITNRLSLFFVHSRICYIPVVEKKGDSKNIQYIPVQYNRTETTTINYHCLVHYTVYLVLITTFIQDHIMRIL